MNDSPYGLTASVWTDPARGAEAFETFAEGLETGTVFLNRCVTCDRAHFPLSDPDAVLDGDRCDYLDPALAWTGVKNSGRGVSLSKFGECCRCVCN